MLDDMVRRGAVLVLGSLLLVSPACGEDLTGTSTSESTESTTTATEVGDLESAKALWEAEGAQSYELIYERDSTWLRTGPVTVTVEDGEITDVTAPEAEDEAEVAEDALTVEGLFDKAADAEENADVVEIEYDDEYGYPKVIDVDHDTEAYDDEYIYTVTGFESLD